MKTFTITARHSSLGYMDLHHALTQATGALWVRENLYNINEDIVKEGLPPLDNNIGDLVIEITDEDEKVLTKIVPVSIALHPINGQPEIPNALYFDPSNFKVLKSLSRYQVEKIGREHYYVHSPSGTFAIDMEQHKGLGACTCSDYEIRRSPTRLKELEKAKLLGYAIHEDCCHLKHLKFLLARPFGEKTKILVKDLSESGRDPVPANEVTEAPSCEVVVKRTQAAQIRLNKLKKEAKRTIVSSSVKH